MKKKTSHASKSKNNELASASLPEQSISTGAKPTVKQTDNRLLINVLLLGLTFLILLNFYFVYQMKKAPTVGAVTEMAIPQIEMITLTTPECPDCFNVEAITAMVRARRVNITSERKIAWTDPQAKKLIDEHSIKTVPTVIITGDTSNLFLDPFIPESELLSGTPSSGGTGPLVMPRTPPPYVSTSTGQVIGRVGMTIIIPDECKDCFNISNSATQLGGLVSVSQVTLFNLKDGAAKEMVRSYNITRLPTIILSKEADLYPMINQSWRDVGSRESDGALVLRETPPPYFNPQTGKVYGMLTVTVLVDKSCTECYDPAVHDSVFSQLGMKVSKKNVFDVSSEEGKKLVQAYGIKGVPTVIISKEASLYTIFNQIWPQVGTVEKDGVYIFRAFDTLPNAKYKDLTTGQVRGAPKLVFNMTSNETTIVDGEGTPLDPAVEAK